MATLNNTPAQTITPNSVAVVTPVNALASSIPQGSNALRLLGVARAVPGGSTGDAATMSIINASSWLPVNMVTSNGQVSGVAGSIATLALGLFTAAAAGGTAIKSNAALGSNSAANSGIVTATTIANLGQTAQTIYVNVGTALAKLNGRHLSVRIRHQLRGKRCHLAHRILRTATFKAPSSCP
jgi:hypothetical protein